MSGGVGVVVIGRNEGERLWRCLDSVVTHAKAIVYVDSGSADGSVAMAEQKGVAVVALDMTTPFTAARARNAGYRRLRELVPDLAYVQFVDGDCEMIDGWLGSAAAFLERHPDVAAVCGRLRERFPGNSLYNRLCDIEWDRPAGEAEACGGIAMMRAAAFDSVSGFNSRLIAGEEPELCLRLGLQGSRIWRLGDEMAVHDAALTRFRQWWRRAMRGGYAAAEGTVLHPGREGSSYRKKLRRIGLWAVALPLVILLLALWNPWWLALAGVYPLQVARLALRTSRKGGDAWWAATFTAIANFPEAGGVLRYCADRARRRPGSLIEYR